MSAPLEDRRLAQGTSEDGAALAARVGAGQYTMTVVEVCDLTPAIRRLTLTAPDLSALAYAPGQDLMVAVANADGTTVRRRYTIRAFDRDRMRVSVDVLRHSGGPGARWARDARPGDTVEAIGPRGKVTIAPDADWHLFAGDASFLPATYRMAEGLPAGTTVVIALAVEGPDEEVPLHTDATLIGPLWAHSGSGPELADLLTGTDLPPGVGQAYLGGELRLVAELRRRLEARGLPRARISPKGYWRSDAANANHGEPARDPDKD
jgi:NADPH-dependent ferric siderophore reductase